MARLRLIIIMLVLLTIIIPKVFLGTYNNVFIRKIQNSHIKAPETTAFFKTSEQYFINNMFLDSYSLASVNLQSPIMKQPQLAKPMVKLTARLKDLAAQKPFLEPGIFIWDYNTGNYVAINADKEIPTASIIKIPILLQLFRRAEAGFSDLNEKMAITDHYITEGSGYLQYKPKGLSYSVYDLARLMIQESDNTATNMILSEIGGVNELNRIMRQWGFNKTHMGNWLPDLFGTNVTTPIDMGTMLYNIDNPDILSLQSRAEIVKIMSKVKNRFLIEEGIPPNAQFIHKTGDIGTMLGDAGIVMLPDGRKYIIVVMVKRPWNSYSAKQFIIDASKTTYNSYASWDL